MYNDNFPYKRFKITLEFLQKHIEKDELILDLGIENPLSSLIKKNGYNINNTSGENLDIDRSTIKNSNAEVITAFEIFEHLLNPYSVLKDIKAKKLVASIPLRLWFAGAYKNNNDERDRHFHEFEDWQFDWLLNNTGWKIVDYKKFTNPVKKIGLRPLLRLFTDRYYLIYAEKI
ncbi:MAG: methyltransferase [Flavobacteriaceae bacterium]|nr:methyltransferase [Flavobacteriaceae bacterium]